MTSQRLCQTQQHGTATNAGILGLRRELEALSDADLIRMVTVLIEAPCELEHLYQHRLRFAAYLLEDRINAAERAVAA